MRKAREVVPGSILAGRVADHESMVRFNRGSARFLLTDDLRRWPSGSHPRRNAAAKIREYLREARWHKAKADHLRSYLLGSALPV